MAASWLSTDGANPPSSHCIVDQFLQRVEGLCAIAQRFTKGVPTGMIMNSWRSRLLLA